MTIKMLLGIILAVFLGGTGCDGDNEAAIEPLSGIWNYNNEGIDKNTCGADDVYLDPDTRFVVTNNDDGTFIVEQGAEEDFECTITGHDFECPNRLFREVEVNLLNGEAVVSYKVSIEGTLSSKVSLYGTQRMELSCEGTLCDLDSVFGWDLPCYYTVEFSARHR